LAARRRKFKLVANRNLGAVRQYAGGLTLETAKKMLEAAEKEAERLCIPFSVAILDAGGNLLAFDRMTDASLAGIQIAQDKAYTAVFSKKPTLWYKGEYTSGELVPLFFHERWITFQGGFPLVKNGKVYGGIGASGGRIEDCWVSRAAIEAGGFDVEDVDNVIDTVKKEMAERGKSHGRERD
jgi:uncharacterized protein GlcG (DUF336 family)